MSKKLLWLVLTFFICSYSLAWDLVVIQDVDEKNRTFSTRTEKGMDRMPGREGYFTSESISIVARTVQVGQRYTRWQLSDPHAALPFRKGQSVTWSLTANPIVLSGNQEQSAPQKETAKRPLGKRVRVRLYHGFGVMESISGVPNSVEGTRMQLQAEGSYLREAFPWIFFDVGFRVDWEGSDLGVASVTSYRYYLTSGASIYLDPILSFGSISPYVGITSGIGFSRSQVAGFEQKGFTLLFPHFLAGVEFPLNEDWKASGEVSVESLYMRQKIPGGPRQKTLQVNSKLGVSVSYLF